MIVSRGSNKHNAHIMNHFDSNFLTSEYQLSQSKPRVLDNLADSDLEFSAGHATGSIAAPVS